MKTLLLLFSTSLFITVHSQEKIARSSDWKLFFENEKVQFYSKYSECNDPAEGIHEECIFLRAVNKLNENVELSWTNEIYAGGKCLTCNNSGEYSYTLQLRGKESITGNCNSNQMLKIFLEDKTGGIKKKNDDLKVTKIITTVQSLEK